ncbi:MAG: hypothetical protein ACKVZH_06670 [Blastocatellia bacterium]
MAKLREVETFTKITEHFLVINKRVGNLRRLKKAFGRLDAEAREIVLEGLMELFDEVSDLQDEFEDINRELDQEPSEVPKVDFDLGKGLLLGIVGVFGQAVAAGLPIVLDEQIKRKLEEEGKFDWPDAIDMEKESEQPKLLLNE